jgi:peptide/nickel transport system permease protein
MFFEVRRSYRRSSRMGLARYIGVRTLLIIPTIMILYTLVFFILRILPGNPVLAVLGTKNIPEEQLRAIMERLGLNKPIHVQYFEYLANLLRGDMGVSLVIQGRPIARDIIERLPATIELSISSIIVSLVLGVSFGYIAARRRGKIIDSSIRVLGSFLYTIFIPWFGMLLQIIFGIWLRLLPIGGRITPGIAPSGPTGFVLLDSLIQGDLYAFLDSLKYLILPSITLGIMLSGPYMRLARNNMIKALDSGFSLAYRARGIKEDKIVRYSLKHAMIPVVTYTGLQFALLLGGAVLTETTFSWPGIGTYLVEKVFYRDYPAIQAVVIVFAFFVGVISLIVDIIYAYIDPRIRY